MDRFHDASPFWIAKNIYMISEEGTLKMSTIAQFHQMAAGVPVVPQGEVPPILE